MKVAASSRRVRGAAGSHVIAAIVVLTIATTILFAAAITFADPPVAEARVGHDPAAHDHASHADSGGGSFFGNFFKVYTPRQVCMFYERPVIWLHVVSDAAIAAAYYSIPLGLVSFVRRRRDVAFGWIFWMFALFILACGTTHLFGLIDIWKPFYRVDGVVKLITAVLSITTAIVLWPLIPRLLALPSPAMLEATVRDRTAELAQANRALRAEIARRESAEKERETLLASEQAARAEAERNNRMKDEFLATLSHELRTPLTAILGWAQLLERSADPSEVSEGLKIIHRNARAQTQLVDDLLDMNRIVAGKMRLEMRPVALGQVIAAAVSAVEPSAVNKRITIETDVPAMHRPVLGDAGRLQQVLWNLLTNAVKFTPSGGTVRIALQDAGDGVTVRVSDTGMGIDPAFLPRIFERFSQADSTTTRQHGGLGLGLAIVRHLVEMHGGSVTVESAGRGKGATFTVTLPARADAPGGGAPGDVVSAYAAPVAFDPSALVEQTALVVDDDADTRRMVKRLLEGMGMRVDVAGSADEAFARLTEQRPSVLICDIGMPGEDGYGLIRRVRDLPPDRGGATPAIALTAFAARDDRDRALAAGFQVHVPKPVDESELAIGILAALRSRENRN